MNKSFIGIILFVVFALVGIVSIVYILSENENSNETAENTIDPVAEAQEFAINQDLNDLCLAISAGNDEILAFIGQTLFLESYSPIETNPLSCVFSALDLNITIQAIKGENARSTYSLNIDSIDFDSVDIISDFQSELATESLGFHFNETTSVDVFSNDIWVNVSIVSDDDNEYKVELAEIIVDVVLENL